MANRKGKTRVAQLAAQKRRTTKNKIVRIKQGLKTAKGRAIEKLNKRLEHHQNKSN